MSERDSIDFGKTDISKLFVKIFLPTLASLMFWHGFQNHQKTTNIPQP